MVAGLLSAFVLLVRPEAVGAEVLLTAGVLLAALAAAVLLHPAGTSAAPRLGLLTAAFGTVRPLLRASDPDGAGSRRARAPGTTR